MLLDVPILMGRHLTEYDVIMAGGDYDVTIGDSWYNCKLGYFDVISIVWMYFDMWGDPRWYLFINSGSVRTPEVTLRHYILVIAEWLSVGFDVATPAWRHVTLYNVTSAAGGNIKNLLICHRMFMIIIICSPCTWLECIYCTEWSHNHLWLSLQSNF